MLFRSRIPFDQAELEAMITDYHAFTGRASAQVEEFVHDVVEPRLAPYKDMVLKIDASLKV